jgi:hypothetical protein
LQPAGSVTAGKDKRAARSRAMSLARGVSDETFSQEILEMVADLLKNPV